MSRTGQCPSCRAVYELEDQAVGQLLQCQCGEDLFACNASGFGEIPIYCPQCSGEYVVDGQGAGQSVQCECGQTIVVPDTVLVLPLENKSESVEPESQSESDTVGCPSCGNRFAVSQADVDDHAQCDCGCRFMISVTQQGQLVAVRSKPATAKNKSDEPTGVHTRGAEESQAASTKENASRSKSFPLGLVLAFAAVGLLLLISLVAFLMRDSAKSVVDSNTESKATTTLASSEASFGSLSGAAATETVAAKPIPAPIPTIRKVGDQDPMDLSAILTPSPAPALPNPKPARPEVAVPVIKKQGLTFEARLRRGVRGLWKSRRVEKGSRIWRSKCLPRSTR